MTSLPSRLRGIGPALRSIAEQERRPDHLILSLPRRSRREGREYTLPLEVQSQLTEHSWLEVQWLDDDFGPGTKLLGALHWLCGHPSCWQEDDLLMVLDDDHAYEPHALGELMHEQLSRGPQHVCSFFSYFFRGILVPQGADIISFQLSKSFVEDLLEYHRAFVHGDMACFLVDDLWVAMFVKLSGRIAVSLRDLVLRQGLQTIYKRTQNAEVEALEALKGEDRRDRVTLRAFDGLLVRLTEAGAKGLQRWGGSEAAKRVQALGTEVKMVERQIAEMERWLEQERGDAPDEASTGVLQATHQLAKMKHLYRMQVPAEASKR